MHAKYIKKEIPDLNGTGRTQAYYKMELRRLALDPSSGIASKGSRSQKFYVLRKP